MDQVTNYQQPTGGYGYGYGMNQWGYDPNFATSPVIPTQWQQMPDMNNALTPAEIQRLRSAKPSGGFTLAISEDDVLRGMCTHKDNGASVVQQLQDGDLYCPICGERWTPTTDISDEEVEKATKIILGLFQDAKYVGELPANVVREYFTMIPLIKKFPELYKFGAKNFNRLLNQRGYYSASDASPYAQYNSLFGPRFGYYPQMYQQPMGYPNGYYQQQPANPAVNPMQTGQPMYAGYYPTQPQQQQPANPAVNPMQTTQQMNTGYYPNPAYPYQQYGQPAQQYNPVFGAPQQPQAAQQPTAAQPTVTTETKVDL